MPKKIDFTFSEAELSIIEKAIQRSESAHLVKRATAVRMLHQGQTPAEVAEIFSVALPTPYQWFYRFRAQGLAGLQNQPRSGRPPIADEAFQAELDATLEQEPSDLGYEFALWTVQRLNQHLQQVTGKQISDERLRVLLKVRSWVYRRPKEDLAHKQDPEARQAAKEFLAELKKTACQDPFFELFFMDETTLSLRFPMRACWMKRGQRKRPQAFTRPDRRLHLIGALNFRTDEVWTQAVERKNSQTFIEFLEYLLVEKFPHQKIVLVLNNTSYHQSRATLTALSVLEPRLRVFWLPKYRPHLNLIERLWRHLKDLAYANRLDVALDNLANRVEEIVRHQNSESHPLKLFFLENFV